MVLINERKYACEKCIKGHRVSGCTHTDRPLYEIKKKGRPATQCTHCKDKRKATGSSVHTKCACGTPKVPPTTTSIIQPALVEPAFLQPSSSSHESEQEKEEEIETRKGQPGSKATFPRGFKDVLEAAAAANALTGMLQEDSTVKIAERRVEALLNPCKCQSGGACKCCHPKKKDKDLDTEQNGESFWCPAADNNIPRPSPPLIVNPHLSPDNMHHPAHTSPHVHKTKLFSPYSVNPASQSRHGRKDINGSNKSSGRASPLPPSQTIRPPTRIKPITDFGRLIGAAINQDGTINAEIPRSAVGLPNLPGISTFDTAAENGGTKVEPMQYEDIDVDMPLAFPTNEDVVIGACMCGEDCSCPGCATHDNGNNNHNAHSHDHSNGCGEGCKGRHDCQHSINVPSGVTSIAQLISLAASHVPSPPETSSRFGYNTTIDPHDTRILPPSAQLNGEVARQMGIVQLKPLECCNGRCQCAPGECICEKECCGCCSRCACAEDDEDARMCNGDGHNNNQDQDPISLTVQQPKSSCCSSKANDDIPEISPISRQNSPLNTINQQQQSPSILFSPDAQTSLNQSRQPSPLSSDTTTPVNLPNNSGIPASIRRASSITSKSKSAKEGHDVSSSSHRRATVTGNPPVNATTTKSATKAIAPYNAQHHRTILPKPTTSHLNTNNGTNNASVPRLPTPSSLRRSSSSAAPTRSGSPAGIRNGESSAGSKAKSNDQQQLQQTDYPVQNISSTSSQPTVIPSQVPEYASYSWEQQTQHTQPQQSQDVSLQPDSSYIGQHRYPYSAEINPPSADSNSDPANATLLAFLQQFTETNSQSSQAQLQSQPQIQPQEQPQFDPSWYNLMQQSTIPQNPSNNGPLPQLTQSFDLDQIILQALSHSQSQQPPSDTQDSTFVHQQTAHALPIHDFNNHFFNAITSVPSAASISNQSIPPAVPISQTSHNHTPHLGRSNNVTPPPGPQFVTLVPGLPAEASYSPNWTSAGNKEQIIHDQRNRLRELENGAQSKKATQHLHNQNVDDNVTNHSQQDSHNFDTRQFETVTGDLIDLSKPLDPDTLNKIMKALQKHNDAISPPTVIPSQVEIPTLSTSTALPDSHSAAMMNLNSISSSMPASQNHEKTDDSNVNGHGNNNKEVTSDLDDMFNQFVTLDGQSQGQDQTATGDINHFDNIVSLSNDPIQGNIDQDSMSNQTSSAVWSDILNSSGWGKANIYGTCEGYL
ncbi:uncharacterized protein L201_005418 [Kwoniella dendrophila CBS 6074]|uniref:Copper-fist domain-containing protein n=1 Tax=Kwoniella dendrophila CBS 6074 TaxID=1295534 RepID=A0AAX4JYQ5_9TREE